MASPWAALGAALSSVFRVCKHRFTLLDLCESKLPFLLRTQGDVCKSPTRGGGV